MNNGAGAAIDACGGIDVQHLCVAVKAVNGTNHDAIGVPTALTIPGDDEGHG